MNIKLFNKLMNNGTIYKKKCLSKSHFITCSCGNQLLRHFSTKCGDVGLCYKCGRLFYVFNHSIIKQYSGSQNSWGDDAILQIMHINEYMQPYMSSNVEKRKDEFINYLGSKILSAHHHGYDDSGDDSVTNLDVFEEVSRCHMCGEKYYGDSEFNHALLEYDSPERTEEILFSYYADHMMNHLEQQEYESVDIDDNNVIWKSDDKKYPFLIIDKDIRTKVVKEVSQFFCKWVLDAPVFNINYDNDPAWDCSGELECVEAGKVQKLSAFDYLGDWMIDAYTGDSEQCDEPGRMVRHITYDDEIMELINSSLEHIWLSSKDDKTKKMLTLSKKFNREVLMLSIAMFDFVCEIPVLQAWHIAKVDAQKAIDQTNEFFANMQEEYDESKCITQKLWQEHFSYIKGTINSVKAKEFFNKLNEVLPNCNKRTLDAIKQVSLPCKLTKEVKNTLTEIINQYVPEK